MRIALKYGGNEREFDVPDELLDDDVRSPGTPSKDATQKREQPRGDALDRALATLSKSPWLGAIRDRRVGLLVADGTRSWAHRRVFPALLDRLAAAAAIEVFVCTGTHSGELPETRSLVENLAGGLKSSRFDSSTGRIWVHDARSSELQGLGTTAHGTPVEVHPRLAECEVFLVVADMKNHYFAGYSNPVKYYVPGLASIEAVRHNHSLALHPRARVGLHPWHPDPRRRGNPLVADMIDAMDRVVGDRPHAALALTTEGERVTWAHFGATREATVAGIEEVDARYGLELAPARFAVISAGGMPFDESLYTAQRALELCRSSVSAGGELLLVAQCANGIGSQAARSNFFEPLQHPLSELLVPPDPYPLYGHKPYRFAKAISELERVWLLSDLDPDDVRSIHMTPATSIQSVVDRWSSAARPGDKVHVVKDGAKVSVVARPADC